jgi:hypothetical protein
MLLALIVLGCPAEQLGIELPPAGAGSIGMEDLLRDTRGVASGDWRPFVSRRFEEMHLDVVEGASVCGTRGRGEPRAFRVAVPGGVDEAAAVAVLISLAKAADTAESPGAWRFCVGDDPAATGSIALGPFPPGPLPADRTSSGPADPGRRLEQLDYRELADTTRTLWRRYGEGAGP